MIFRPELAELVRTGAKTVTRRPLSDNPRSPWFAGCCALKPGRDYAVQPGRGVPAVCRVVVTDISKSLVGVPAIDEAEAAREGFASGDEFVETWLTLHGSWEPGEVVWRVEFEAPGGGT